MPRAGVRTSEYGRDYRVGYSMRILEANELRLQVGIEAQQRHIPGYLLEDHGGGREQRVLGQATVEW